jgi:integrase
MHLDQTFGASKKFTRAKALEAFRLIAPHEEEDLLDAKAHRTIIQYASAWRVYLAWCEEEGHTPIPAAPQQLRAYVRHLSHAQRSPATIDSYIAAIATVHRYHGHAVDRTLLIEPLKAARRRAGPPRRARALVTNELQGLTDRFDHENPRDCRDAVMLLLGWAAALRGAELVGLDWRRAGGRAYGGTGFLAVEAKGLQATLLTSKAAQITTVQLAIPDAEMPSLRLWLDQWLAHAKVQGGEPLFRPIDRLHRIQPARLSGDAVAKIVRRRMLAHAQATGFSDMDALMLAKQYSSHSMRRGYCTTASDARIPLGQIRARSRHTSDATLGKYIQSAEGWNSSGLGGIGF